MMKRVQIAQSPKFSSNQDSEVQQYNLSSLDTDDTVEERASIRKEPQCNGRVILRKCEDVNIRTGGFQRIEEESWRPRHRLQAATPRR